MPYVGSDGRVTERRSPWRFSIITDILSEIYDIFALFFQSIVNPPRLEQGGVARYSAPRNTNPRPRPPSGRPSGGANIRGIKNLQGSTRAPAGGG